MTAILAALTPAEAPGLLLKALAILGGAVVAGLFVGFLFRVLTRLLTTRPLPLWAVRLTRLLGAVAGGWLVALWLFGGGGGGIGGAGGFGLGGSEGSGEKDAKKKTSEEESPKKDRVAGPGAGDLVRVAVLGLEPLKAIHGDGAVDINFCFRIEGDDRKKVLDLDGVKKELLERRKKSAKLQVDIVIYRDSPVKTNDYVRELNRWLRDEKLFKDFDSPAATAPR